MDSLYGLNYSIQSFAIANEFVKTLNKACYKLGQSLKPFCIYANDNQKQAGVIDFANFNGLAGKGSLLDEITEYRRGVFEGVGISIDTSDEIKRKLLFYDYLMSISVCYVEIPKYVTKDGMAKPTFDKFLCTRNPSLMGVWMGDTQSAMQAKYSARIAQNQIDFNENNLRFVKLNQSSKGNTITMPRNASAVDKMTCVPLFMLYIFTEGFKPLLDTNIVEFTFLKDNGTKRVLPTTLNQKILMDLYHDTMFVNTMLSGVDISSVKQGGMNLSSKASRGYIKVPEVGASIYDGTGTRSLNIARLLSAEVVTDENKINEYRSFINVDLNSVVQNFKDAVEYAIRTIPGSLRTIYKDVVGKEADANLSDAVVCSNLFVDVDGKANFLSTTFFRQLHNYMVQLPQLFPLYTGKPNVAVASSTSYGLVEADDFG